MSKTKSGIPCLPWSQQVKSNGRVGYWTGSSGAAAKGVGDHKYCRNPDGEPGPWCYTTSSATRWQLCEVGSPAASCEGELPSTLGVGVRRIHTRDYVCVYFCGAQKAPWFGPGEGEGVVWPRAVALA